MKKICSLCCIWICLALLFTSCKKDDYVYPPVQQDFLTAFSGSDGALETLLTDKGERYTVTEDLSKSRISANSSARVVSNFETLSSADKTVRVYGVLSPISVAPLPPNSAPFVNGIKTDPVNMISIWMGRDYLNIILSIVMQEKKHSFHFVEEKVEYVQGTKLVTLLLYHDADGDAESFSKRAYLSIPLRKYFNPTDPNRKIVIRFKYWTRNREGVKVLETKYADNGFTYIPF